MNILVRVSHGYKWKKVHYCWFMKEQEQIIDMITCEYKYIQCSSGYFLNITLELFQLRSQQCQPNFSKIWYIKSDFNVSNFYAIRITPQKMILFFLFGNSIFLYFKFDPFGVKKYLVWGYQSIILGGGGYYCNKVVLRLWNFLLFGVKPVIIFE